MTAPFLILGLPRSRTAWLARFLTYGDWICGHEELRHMRSLDDVKTWLSQPCVGSAETAAAPFWRLIPSGTRIVIVRRNPVDVVRSLLAMPGLSFDEARLMRAVRLLDRKLDQIEARCDNVLSVSFDSLSDEATCRAVFEHCLPYDWDAQWLAHWAAINVRCDMRAMMRHATAFGPQMHKLAREAKAQTLATMMDNCAPDLAGMTFQVESIDAWHDDARALFERHCMTVGEAPDEWQRKNWPMMRAIFNAGAMQITTARCNGRMFGYLMTLVSPSLVAEGALSAIHTTFYADPHAPGIGLKLQRAALTELRKRGVKDVFFEAGQRGDGPRLSAMYRRMGAQDHSMTYRLELEAA